MRSTHHHDLGVGTSAGDQGRQQAVAIAQEQRARGLELEREGGIDDVARCQSEVEVAAIGADRLGDLGDKRDHVVIGRLLDLADPFGIDCRFRFDRRERVLGDEATRRLGTSHGDLDAEHVLEPGAFGPERPHLGEGVAGDHATPSATGA
jgi:hypothetical protein